MTTFRRPGDVPTRVFDWGTIKWLVTPHLDAGGGLTTGEVIIYPAQGHAPHVHPHEEEVIYVISGEGEQTVGDGPAFPIREGDAVYIPASDCTRRTTPPGARCAWWSSTPRAGPRPASTPCPTPASSTPASHRPGARSAEAIRRTVRRDRAVRRPHRSPSDRRTFGCPAFGVLLGKVALGHVGVTLGSCRFDGSR
ncbi:cupin domain-containing protein [Dactylosporangium sp. McL0621]|uniref:cupin domain-containing protein n=1 Tax=Dactylosporangium sp. McL0621 TaxID=3415678 RepID=UPI003CEDCDED